MAAWMNVKTLNPIEALGFGVDLQFVGFFSWPLCLKKITTSGKPFQNRFPESFEAWNSFDTYRGNRHLTKPSVRQRSFLFFFWGGGGSEVSPKDPNCACSLPCCFFLGLPFWILFVKWVKPTKVATMETIGRPRLRNSFDGFQILVFRRKFRIHPSGPLNPEQS